MGDPLALSPGRDSVEAGIAEEVAEWFGVGVLERGAGLGEAEELFFFRCTRGPPGENIRTEYRK